MVTARMASLHARMPASMLHLPTHVGRSVCAPVALSPACPVHPRSLSYAFTYAFLHTRSSVGLSAHKYTHTQLSWCPQIHPYLACFPNDSNGSRLMLDIFLVKEVHHAVNVANCRE